MMKTIAVLFSISAMLCLAIPARADCSVDYDVNGDGCVNSTDVSYLVAFLFADGPAPPCDGDVNGDGVVDPADIFWLNNFLLNGGGHGCIDH